VIPLWATAALAATCLSIAPAAGQALAEPRQPEKSIRTRLDAAGMFDAARAAESAGRPEDALVLLVALAADPDAEIRAEALFRRAMLLDALGRSDEAAVTLRRLIDEKPNVPQVRLELARVLARRGDEAGARRELRQAQAGMLPPDVAAVIDQFAAALRSQRPFGGSLQVALAPDSNVNRATDARTLDTIIAPLTLSRAARAQSGLGLRGSGTAFARIGLSDTLSLLPRLSGSASLYRRAAFDDVSASALLGLEWVSGRDRVTPAVGPGRRWYGGRPYADTRTIALDWLHPMGRRAQLSLSGSAASVRYRNNPLQTGGLFDLSATVERALSPRAGVGVTIGGTRQTARDPGYSTTAVQIGASGWRDLGRTTVFASAAVRRTKGDERLFIFADRRREWLVQANVGVTLRTLTWHGFAPLLRATHEHNASSVGLFDYRRTAFEVGVVRAF
jgi:tetratricopeptide (TPR) repeat protein